MRASPSRLSPSLWASFADMVALKGKKDIGDQINKSIIGPLANANSQLSQSDFPDFNDPTKLDFSKNRAEGDDILGDAYEYLMRHFATESGKSKGQFYTPAEVSRIMAKVIGIGQWSRKVPHCAGASERYGV